MSGIKGRTGVYKRTIEHGVKISQSKLGHIVLDETKKKIGLANSISKKGTKYSEEHKRKIGEATKGEKHYRWKGGYENTLMLNRKRRIKKFGNGGSHTLGEWEHIKALYNWTCPSCWKKEPEIKLTEDHIIPISKGGSDNIENIQPLCRSCNSKKGNKVKLLK